MNTNQTLRGAAFAIVAAFFSPSVWANLIVNGDFESPVISGTFASSGFEYRTTLPGWTVSSPSPHSGVVLFNALYGQPLGGGAQSLQIEFPGDYIEQSIATVAGTTYLLTFDLSAYFPPGTSLLDVAIDGAAALSFAGTSLDYTTYSVFFVASSASTSIHLESNAGATGTYPHLDNVSVEAVPEPGSLALLGIALAAFGVSRRRKRG